MEYRVIAGTPQTRISESVNKEDPVYLFYTTEMLQDDLEGLNKMIDVNECKQIQTAQSVQTIHTGDVVYSLISCQAAIVQSCHDGFLITQNFVVLKPESDLDPAYLVFVLNENVQIANAARKDAIGTHFTKMSVRQLQNLELPTLPNIEKQRQIGEVYLAAKKRAALEKRKTDCCERAVIELLRKEQPQ